MLMDRLKNQIITEEDARLLRQVDWRFLLSAERFKRSICFGDGDLARGTAAISDFCTVVTSPQAHPPAADFDLATADTPAEARLQAAFQALRPGGICYTVWQAWRVGGARAIRQRLAAAGFEKIRLFWVFPSPRQPRLWIPIRGQQAPGRYIARWLVPGGGFLQRAARQGLMLVYSFLMLSGLVPFVSAVAHKAGPGENGLASKNGPAILDGPAIDNGLAIEDGRTIEDIFSVIQAEWSHLHPENPVERLSYLPQAGGSAPTNKIVLRVFTEPAGPLQWVVKLSRMRENVQSLQCEQKILNKIGQLNKQSAFNLRVPEPVFNRAHNGLLLYGQTALAGESLSRVIRPDTLRPYALQLAEWQAELMRCSKDWPRETTSEAYITELFALLEPELIGREFSAAQFARIRAILSPLKGLPMTCAHNDFAIWNIIQMEQGLGVIDWPEATESGLPLMDLVYALSSMVLTLAKVWEAPGAPDVYRRAVDPSTPTGRIFAESISAYAGQVGLDPALVAPLRMLTWMLRCSFDLKAARFAADAPKISPQSMYLALWKMELALQD